MYSDRNKFNKLDGLGSIVCQGFVVRVFNKPQLYFCFVKYS
jgi:hypothetical protein